MGYTPSQGDLVIIHFRPQVGPEQTGKRPALVVSNNQFHQRTNLMIVCPITNTDRGFPLHVPLKEEMNTKGFIMCEHVTSMDYEARGAQFKECVDQATMDKVLAITALFF